MLCEQTIEPHIHDALHCNCATHMSHPMLNVHDSQHASSQMQRHLATLLSMKESLAEMPCMPASQPSHELPIPYWPAFMHAAMRSTRPHIETMSSEEHDDLMHFAYSNCNHAALLPKNLASDQSVQPQFSSSESSVSTSSDEREAKETVCGGARSRTIPSCKISG